MSSPSELTLFFGRLHPLLVHLPIGLIVLVAGLELLARVPRYRHANASAGFILALAIPATLSTVVVGWLLSWAGGYETRLLQWHKWTGLATAAACTLAGVLYGLERKQLYRWCLLSSFLVLVAASHFGGSLTHGRDYLARYAPQPWRKPAGLASPTRTPPGKAPAVNDLPTFAAVVQPVLRQNCVACHGPEKAKGGLRVDSLAALLKGGEGGPAVVPGKAAESPLLQRLLLPLNHDDHMPPEGKPQPSPEDIALLKWWIETGAPNDKKIGALNPPPNIAHLFPSGRVPETLSKPQPPRHAERSVLVPSGTPENSPALPVLGEASVLSFPVPRGTAGKLAWSRAHGV